MNKVKTEDEYEIDLLDKHTSKRDKPGEKEFKLSKEPPSWATKENLWTTLVYDKKVEGWKKLCIEAYLCGWIDYFDVEVAIVADDARTVYFKWVEKSPSTLYVYLDSGSTNVPGGQRSSGASVPKPPPPYPG